MNADVSVPFEDKNSYACQVASPGCLDALAVFLPPNKSCCWLWWDPASDRVMKDGLSHPPKGCDCKLRQELTGTSRLR